MSDDYGTSPQAYLARARRCLEHGTKEGLFHAAFELRCCVEARLAEYFELCETLAGRRLQMHKATDNQRTVNAITSGDLISSITFRLPDGTVLRQFHTPVPASLQAYVKRGIDHLRHAQREYRPADDIWWSETGAELLRAYRAAWITCRGEMPLPPLWNVDTGEMHPVHVLFDDRNRAALQRFSDPRNMFMEIDVDRLDEPPVDWVCDLKAKDEDFRPYSVPSSPISSCVRNGAPEVCGGAASPVPFKQPERVAEAGERVTASKWRLLGLSAHI